jgi:hypothetical protein
MFRGTKKYGPKQYSRIIQKNGGQNNAFTSRDFTAYYENLASDRLGIALALEADRLTGLLVEEEKFLTERKVVQEERRLRIKDDPSASLLEEVVATAFKSHPYKWPVTGWMEDLDRLTRADFLNFYRTYYQPANATLVVIGDFEKEKVVPQIEKTFGQIPGGAAPQPQAIQEPPQEPTSASSPGRGPVALRASGLSCPPLPAPRLFSPEGHGTNFGRRKKFPNVSEDGIPGAKGLGGRSGLCLSIQGSLSLLLLCPGHARSEPGANRRAPFSGIRRMGKKSPYRRRNRTGQESNRSGIYFCPGFHLYREA